MNAHTCIALDLKCCAVLLLCSGLQLAEVSSLPTAVVEDAKALTTQISNDKQVNYTGVAYVDLLLKILRYNRVTIDFTVCTEVTVVGST